MAKLLVTRRFPGGGVGMVLGSGHEVRVNEEDRLMERSELLSAAAGRDGVLTQLGDRVDREFFDAAGPQLRVVSNYAVGYNNVDVVEATRRGIVVTNTPGVLTEATADIAWLLLMGVARRAHEGEALARSGDWRSWKPNLLLGSDLVGATLAIVGAGRIGMAVSRRARAWSMKILYVARSPKAEFERELGAERRELDEAMGEADFVSIHVPLTAETTHLIDERRLRLMKPTGYLVNTARGPIVDEAALVRVLREGAIGGAGLDVYEREPELEPGLADLSNTFLLPHLGSATIGTRSAMGELAARNLLAVVGGQRPPHPINGEVQDEARTRK